MAQMYAESNLSPAQEKELRASLSAQERKLFDKGQPIKLHEITEGTIKTVRIRYFNKETWETEDKAREYVRGFLAHRVLDAFRGQVWSQSVGVPEIECLIDFTDEHLKGLRDEGLSGEGFRGVPRELGEGRLLIWNTEACFRSAAGTWWFVSAFDHFHRSHPKGDRKLARESKGE